MTSITTRFIETYGGSIIGPDGREYARVAVDDLQTREAARVAEAIVAALEAALPAPTHRGEGQNPDRLS